MKITWIKKILLLCFSVVLLFSAVACGKENTPKDYKVTLATDYGKTLNDVEIRIYTDATKADIVAAGNLDENGSFSFRCEEGAIGYVIYFEGEFTGYKVEEYYEIKGQTTEVVLETQLLDVNSLEGVVFKAGDVFADMMVETPDGTQYLISELLKEKKAVVLNFWYLNCQPCRLEFPYLQTAYEEYADVIEVLAVNPVDGTDKKISDFQAEKGFTFPMAVCDNEWESYMGNPSFPTTVVIDRYGIVGFVHTGAITEEGIFEKLFEFFTSDDYEQTTIRNLSELD